MKYVVQTSYGPVEVEGGGYFIRDSEVLEIVDDPGAMRPNKVATFAKWEFISIKKEEAQ